MNNEEKALLIEAAYVNARNASDPSVCHAWEMIATILMQPAITVHEIRERILDLYTQECSKAIVLASESAAYSTLEGTTVKAHVYWTYQLYLLRYGK